MHPSLTGKKLGILVKDDKYLDQVVNLTRTAHQKGIEVRIFFTGKGVLLTQKADFEALVGKARLSVCDVSFRGFGLSADVPGLNFKDFATQAKNAEMVDECDRYVVF
ncbi:DsrE family protein [Desulfonatronovibrio hydrogenovorans]|uniref:DsrE family protein n=1 Tax=Desulfonatronovibrio hydrogenovorans TaxID=53245 RepID=UPI0005570721|nr:DsrE family protein [Desulfonatronovibrio hydrogenovorans]